MEGPKLVSHESLVEQQCHKQGHLPLDQVTQSSIQPGLEHFQGGGSHSFSGQPVPVLQIDEYPVLVIPVQQWGFLAISFTFQSIIISQFK